MLEFTNKLFSLLDDDWAGGFVVGATTTYQTIMGNHSWKLGRHNDRSRIETEDLHDVLGDQGFQVGYFQIIAQVYFVSLRTAGILLSLLG